jgi:heme-degrading monooxygenase HmoA
VRFKVTLSILTKEERRSMKKIIVRIWRGKVPEAKAEEYAEYHFEIGVKRIQGIAGNLGVQVLRHTEKEITEFTTISYWESLDAIRRFAGDDIEKPHHLPKDPEYLIELPNRVLHYELDYSDMIKVAQSDSRRQ